MDRDNQGHSLAHVRTSWLNLPSPFPHKETLANISAPTVE